MVLPKDEAGRVLLAESQIKAIAMEVVQLQRQTEGVFGQALREAIEQHYGPAWLVVYDGGRMLSWQRVPEGAGISVGVVFEQPELG